MRPQIRARYFRFPGFLLLGGGKLGNRTQAVRNIRLRVSWVTSERNAG